MEALGGIIRETWCGPIKFDEEKRKLMMGYIVPSLANIVINNEDVQKWAQVYSMWCLMFELFETKRGKWDIVKKKRKGQTKTRGFTLDRDESAKLYTRFVKKKAHPISREKPL